MTLRQRSNPKRIPLVKWTGTETQSENVKTLTLLGVGLNNCRCKEKLGVAVAGVACKSKEFLAIPWGGGASQGGYFEF